MADLSDVENALVDIVSGILYPNGTSSPASVSVPCRVFRGWPIPADLDADMAAHRCAISVFPPPGAGRNTSRYPRDWQQKSANPATISMNAVGNQITLTGAIPSPYYNQNITIGYGGQNGGVYVYQTVPSDTLNSVASALAALIPGASVVGAVITVPATMNITIASVGVIGIAAMETRRQERAIWVTVWSHDPIVRDEVASAIDSALSDPAYQFIEMPDGFSARFKYSGTVSIDTSQKAQIFRRDLVYLVEYATTKSQTLTEITAQQISMGVQASSEAPIATVQINAS